MTLVVSKRRLVTVQKAGSGFRSAFFLSVWVLVASLALGGCSGGDSSKVSLQGATMGTTWHITLVEVPDSVDAQHVEQRVQDTLQTLNGLMSTYDVNSQLSQFNRAEINQWFPVDEQTAFVVNLAIEIGALTGGAFDVTVDPLIRLWGFGPGADL